jgi:diaminohydroxyphosphoribosylaminopyrimidine deaminase/5-amino-6-(5-phosphoribosylamino)uracil reductase
MTEEALMRLALTLAESARGQTGINPLVGAVVVNEGRVVGTGAHLRRGEAHAEVHALNMAGSYAKNSTLYVTLEPCCHQGLTPACTERMIRDGVGRVVVATLDPNPLVAGNGVQKLRDAGIEVQVGLLAEEARKMNEVFNKFILQRQPFITLKSAMTLDGKIAAYTGDSQWISGEPAREEVHQLRHEHEAIMVGIGTVLCDNPKLTTRRKVEGINPIRIVVDSSLRIPLHMQVLEDRSAPTWIMTTIEADPKKKAELRSLGIEVLEVNEGKRVDLGKAVKLLGQKEVASVLVEGGATLGGAFLGSHYVDKVVLYIAPKIVGGNIALWNMEGVASMKEALPLQHVTYQQIGEDLRVIGYPKYTDKP